uniref:Inner centromere protein ARK-binding domain-containing protein n=1 Tax=Periophthalmus magnuspinnatus TaxID=409849 RepID=A0A3B3Z7P1_9GOBI
MAVTMNSVLSPVRSLMQMFEGKAQAFISEIDNVHMVWLEEIQQEANRMFTRDFNAEPELMPKTPSQKKTRRKRVSLGRQEDGQARRRFSKGRRSNLRGSSSSALNCITEEGNDSQASTSKMENTRPKRATRKKQTKTDEEEGRQTHCSSNKSEEMVSVKAEVIEILEENEDEEKKGTDEKPPSSTESPKSIPSPELVVSISPAERRSAELAVEVVTSPGHTVVETEVTELNASKKSCRSSVRHSLKLRHSLAGLRHSMTQESIRRASRRSMLKRKVSRVGNSTCSSSVGKFAVCRMVLPLVKPVGRVTRSVAAHSPKLAPQPLFAVKINTPDKRPGINTFFGENINDTKRKAPDVEESPSKRSSPPKKSQSPHMKSFLHTVQKNQMLMMTPNSLGRSTVLKSFIKHTTPLRMDQKTKERYKLEALKKKQEQEIERMKKMEEEKKKKQEELKKKRDERLRRVFEAKVKEEQREEEKKKKIEQKMAQIDEKNDKVGKVCRVADEKKKKVALKRQEELELKKKQEEEARKKKLQQEEEKRQQELLAKKKAEEEERAQKLTEARRALELKREQERERELEREDALQREVQRAAREKERKELEEKRKALEEKRKLFFCVLFLITQRSPQSYSITPKGANKIPSKNPEDYGMDQNSDDSTDDESAPRKPIPSWAEGHNLQIFIKKQYFNPPNLDAFFGKIEPPNLENIFYKNKPRYMKRTSSAVWHSPPIGGK